MPMVLRALLFLPALILGAPACDAGSTGKTAAFGLVPGPEVLPSPEVPSPTPEQSPSPVVAQPEKAEEPCAVVTAGTFGGRPVGAALEAMATGKVVSIIPSQKSGRTVKITLQIEPAWRVFFKPRHRVHAFTRPEGEVGAFRINRLLGMNHVPPAVVRKFNGSVFHSAFKRNATAQRLEQLEREVLSKGTDDLTGALLLWLDEAVNFEPPASLMAKMRRSKAALTPEEESLVWDLSWMLVLDHLTNNYDRFTGGNILRRKDGRLAFIDNGAAFGPDQEWKAARRKFRLRSLTRHSPAFTRALLRLEPRVMASCTGEVLSARDIEQVLSRRDELLGHLRELEKTCPSECRFVRELEAP